MVIMQGERWADSSGELPHIVQEQEHLRDGLS